MKTIKKSKQQIIIAFFIFSILLGIYFLSYSGVPVSDDEQQYASVAQNIALRGDFDSPQLYGNNRIQGKSSTSGLLHPILGAPIIFLIRSTSFGEVQALYLLPPLYTALTAALIFLICVKSGFTQKTGVITSLMFGLGTIAWPYSQTFFREPLAMLLLTGSWLALLLATDNNQTTTVHTVAWIVFVGTFVGALFTKILLLSTLPAIIYIAVIYRQPNLRQENKKRKYSTILLVIILVISFIVIFNTLLPDEASSRFSERFFARLWKYREKLHYAKIPEAAAGMLFSPSKGLLIYSPFLLLIPLGWVRTKKEDKQRLIFAGLALTGLIVTQAIAYGTNWWNTSWGTRFLLPILPILLIAIAPVVEKIQTTNKTYFKALFWSLIGMSFAIQVGGVLIATPVYLKDLYYRKFILDLGKTIWEIPHAPLFNHWLLLISGEPVNPAIWRLYSKSPALIFSIWFLCLLLIGGSAFLLLSILKNSISIRAAKKWGFPATLFLMISIPFLILHTYKTDPRYGYGRDDISATHIIITQETQPGDVILVYPYLNPIWYHFFNFYREETVWYSLPRTYPSGEIEATNSLVNELSEDYSRIWIVSETALGEPQIVLAEKYLAHKGALIYQTNFNMYKNQGKVIRVALYEIDN